MRETSLPGVWLLNSYTVVDASGAAISTPMGARPSGVLIYTPDGYMSVHIAATGGGDPRTAPGLPAAVGRDDAEAVTSSRPYVSYGGRYRQRGGSEVAHEVRWSSVPQWLGSTQVRRMSLTAGVLVLSAATRRADGDERTPRLVWTRSPGEPAGHDPQPVDPGRETSR